MSSQVTFTQKPWQSYQFRLGNISQILSSSHKLELCRLKCHPLHKIYSIDYELIWHSSGGSLHLFSPCLLYEWSRGVYKTLCATTPWVVPAVCLFSSSILTYWMYSARHTQQHEFQLFICSQTQWNKKQAEKLSPPLVSPPQNNHHWSQTPPLFKH